MPIFFCDTGAGYNLGNWKSRERETEREREREAGTGHSPRCYAIIIEIHVRVFLKNVLNGAVSPSRFLKLLSMAHCTSNIKNLF